MYTYLRICNSFLFMDDPCLMFSMSCCCVVAGKLTSDCCGSITPDNNTRQLTFSTLETVGPSIYSSVHSDLDISPPNRISDLRITGTESGLMEGHRVLLAWSAPGGDWNNGKGLI